jgi:hypothetical protein
VAQTPGAKLAVERLLAHSADFRQAFADHLRAVVYGGDAQRNRNRTVVRFDDFQFLEEDQIDANIEFALTQQEVMRSVEEALPALNGMISSLVGWSSVQAHLNPLKPESFVYALRESLGPQLGEDEARSVLMVAAAGILGSSLRQLYKEIADWLRSQGIEAVQITTVTLADQAGSKEAAAPTAVSRTMLTLDKLRRLLSGELDAGGHGGDKDFTHTVPASYVALEDMKMLEPMMKRLSSRASEASAQSEAQKAEPAQSEALDGRRAEQLQTKKLGLQLGEEVVRMMLENLMRDQRLLASVRQSLKTLEAVLIRLSQSDPRFFSDRQHPARQYLDKITSRSLAFSSSDEAGFARYQKSLDNSVSVLVLGDGDSAAFARTLRKLEEGWGRDEQEQRRRAEEAARGLLHAEQRNLLAQRLAQEFSDRLQDKRVPELIASFLRGPWAQVVAEAQLQFADGTADAGVYLALVDDLVWSAQLRLTRRNRSRLVAMVPGMLVTLRQGLGLISYPQERIAAFFDELIALHEKAFEAGRSVAAPLAPDVAPPDDPQDLLPAPVQPELEREDFWMAGDEVAESGFLQEDVELSLDFTAMAELPEVPEQQEWSTDSLNPGAWVDLALGGVWVRAQLTWASPHRTLFMFISGAGLAHSMSRRTMDRLHGLGLIRLISDGHVMDNALDRVAQAALRNDVENAGGKGRAKSR